MTGNKATDQELAREWARWLREEEGQEPPCSSIEFAAVLDRLAEGGTEWRIMTDKGHYYSSANTLRDAQRDIKVEDAMASTYQGELHIESRHVGPWLPVK